MSWIKKMTPTFIKRLDQKLLTKYPNVWRTKLHYILFFSLIVGNLVAYGLASIYPVAIDQIPSSGNFMALYFISCVFGGFILLYWGFTQFKFKLKDHRFGVQLMTFAIYSLGILSFSINIFVFQYRLTERVANVEETQTFMEDRSFVEKLDYFRYYAGNEMAFLDQSRKLQIAQIVGKYGFSLDDILREYDEAYYAYYEGELYQSFESVFSAKCMFNQLHHQINCYGFTSDIWKTHWGLTLIAMLLLPAMFFMLSYTSFAVISGVSFIHVVVLMAATMLFSMKIVSIENFYFALSVFVFAVVLFFRKNESGLNLLSFFFLLLAPGTLLIYIMNTHAIEMSITDFGTYVGLGFVLTTIAIKLLTIRTAKPKG